MYTNSGVSSSFNKGILINLSSPVLFQCWSNVVMLLRLRIRRLTQRFSTCGPRTTSGPRRPALWSARKVVNFSIFFIWVIRMQFFVKLTKNGHSDILPGSLIWEICSAGLGGPRTETKFTKWSASLKRLRTAGLTNAHLYFFSLWILYVVWNSVNWYSIHATNLGL